MLWGDNPLHWVVHNAYFKLFILRVTPSSTVPWWRSLWPFTTRRHLIDYVTALSVWCHLHYLFSFVGCIDHDGEQDRKTTWMHFPWGVHWQNLSWQYIARCCQTVMFYIISNEESGEWDILGEWAPFCRYFRNQINCSTSEWLELFAWGQLSKITFLPSWGYISSSKNLIPFLPV